MDKLITSSLTGILLLSSMISMNIYAEELETNKNPYISQYETTYEMYEFVFPESFQLDLIENNIFASTLDVYNYKLVIKLDLTNKDNISLKMLHNEILVKEEIMQIDLINNIIFNKDLAYKIENKDSSVFLNKTEYKCENSEINTTLTSVAETTAIITTMSNVLGESNTIGSSEEITNNISSPKTSSTNTLFPIMSMLSTGVLAFITRRKEK